MLSALWPAIQQEYDSDTLILQLNAVKTLIRAAGVPFFTQEEVNSTGEYLIKTLETALNNRDVFENAKTTDPDKKYIVTELNSQDEHSLFTCLAEVFAAFFVEFIRHCK